jgi:hyperosmotically inducible periplasmic protein
MRGKLMKRLSLKSVMVVALLGMGSVVMAQVPGTAPDNTGMNVTDRNPGAMTAGEQSNSKADIALTSKIRRAVMKDDALSTAAHNVKIISVNGVVTLRGPVNNEQEKTAIGSKAEAIAGADKVENQLQVKNE